MPSFVSVKGQWEPKQEKWVNPKTAEIYEGPDRSAVQAIEENGGSIGTDVKKLSENIILARQMGMTVDQYLQLSDPEAIEADEKRIIEAKKEVVNHLDTGKRKPTASNGNGAFKELK